MIMINKNIKNIVDKILYSLWSIFTSISAICIATLVIINSTWIYKVVIYICGLSKETGLSSEVLMSEYKGLINYLQNPFVDKLSFENFAISNYGEIHFYEVKEIFLMLIIITIIFVMALIIKWVRNKKKKNSYDKKVLLKSFNFSSNILIGFFSSVVILYFIDFSWAFTMFHKMFFRNDYWIFDPRIDPIINALPEELFMICGGAILIVLFIMIFTTKYIYYKTRREFIGNLRNENIRV